MTTEGYGGKEPHNSTGVPLVDETLVAALREDLQGAHWEVDRVEALLGPVATAAHFREQRVPGLLALQGRVEPGAILTRLFLLGDFITPLEVAQALPTLGLAGAERLGLVTTANRMVTALVDLRPHAANLAGTDYHWWVASDLSEVQTGKPLRPEHVLGIGSASLSLLRMTIRKPVEKALDLGCGCGIQSLYLATHAQEVVATDLSERACAFTRFNALLNGVDNIEVRTGSLFEPVSGEVFDLITSNPPFVITPDRVRSRALMEYRDGGMDRDNLIAQVIRTAPSHLRPGGTLQMLANWEIHGAPVEWDRSVREWLVEGAEYCRPDGLRAWVVMRELIDYAKYAELWMRDSGGTFTSHEEWEDDYRDWVEGFTGAGVAEIGMGFLAVQRDPLLTGLLMEVQTIHEGVFPDGTTVAAALRNLTLPADWPDRCLVRAADMREVRHYLPGESDPQMIFLNQGAGMERNVQVSTHVAALVGASDGQLTVQQIIGALAAITGASEMQVRQDIAAELPPLLQAGMLHFQ